MIDLLTYRHPRSMQQAFGPYTSNALLPKGNGKPSWLERAMVRVGGAMLLVLVVSGFVPR